jgi:hypothetical protein
MSAGVSMHMVVTVVAANVDGSCRRRGTFRTRQYESFEQIAAAPLEGEWTPPCCQGRLLALVPVVVLAALMLPGDNCVPALSTESGAHLLCTLIRRSDDSVSAAHSSPTVLAVLPERVHCTFLYTKHVRMCPTFV